MPLGYRLDLRVDPAATGFGGHAEITMRLERAADHVWLNAQGLQAQRIIVTDAAGQASTGTLGFVDDERGIARLDFGRMLAPQRLVVAIDYRAQYSDGDGAYRIQMDGRRYIATATQPLGARRMFPGFDEPGHKTPFKLSLTVPDDLVALANSAATTEALDGKGWKTVSFAPTQPLPTYLVAFAVGPWGMRAAPTLPSRHGRDRPVPLRAIALAARAGDMQWVLAQAPAIVEALEDYYDQPYPWAKLDLLDVDGGMENPGLVALGSLGSAAPDAPLGALQGAFDLAAHELAHQWTGNIVTMAWWDDLWLSEALTIWMQHKLSLRLHPEYRADLQQVREAQRAMAADALASARQVRQPVVSHADIDGVFDGVSYGKGAAVVAMFEQYVGAAAFRRGLRDYVHAHAMESASATDLVEAVAHAAGDDGRLRAAFRSYIEQPGVPYLRITVQPAAQGLALHLHQDRYRPIGSSAQPALRWGIPACVRYAGRDGRARSRCTLMDQADARMDLLDAAPDAWVMPNAGARGYYRFGLDGVAMARLGRHLDALDDAERLAYADAVDASFRMGDIDAGDLLAALQPLAAFGGKDLAVATLDQASWLWRHAATGDRARARLVAWARAAWSPRLESLGIRARAGEPEADRGLRALLAEALALTYRLPEVRAALLPQGDAALSALAAGRNPGFVPGASDLLPAVLGVAVQERGAPAVQVLAGALAATNDVALRRAIVAALGYADDPGLGTRIRDLALDPRIAGGERIALALGRRDTPAARDASWAWLARPHARLLEHIPPSRVATLPVLLGAEGCSVAEVDRLQAFFGPLLAQRPELAPSLLQAREAIQQCAALKQAQDRATLVDGGTRDRG
ncbi:M1 family metallopeptidase [Luteimonas sp. 50]|uniref:Aminopeptidase n=1 Tax=Cognatiluteimonas sedimenti TaxID=2927791 RepID=A0ABT0A0M7_9GAMM|nr:M1 family metallopeptidase [Lysobacter sedimenti]MCJ0824534.1 M1 family metallopeptidase [Lysobacter sedimenti]